MLSENSGVPIGMVNSPGTRDHGKIIHVLPEDSESPELKVDVRNPMETLGLPFFRKLVPRMTGKDISIMNAHLKLGEPPIKYPYLLEGYNKAVEALNGTIGKDLKLFGKATMIPLFDPNLERECDYIAGVAGVGKSTYASDRARLYHELYPDNKIFNFTEVRDDPAYADLPITYITINDELMNKEDPVRPEEFEDSMVIFDDIDAIVDDKLLKAVRKIRDRMLSIGRHSRICVITTTHMLCNGHETKVPLAEARSITFFPQSGSMLGNIKTYLEKHAQLPKPMVEKTMNLRSRWATHVKSYPACILHEHGIYLTR